MGQAGSPRDLRPIVIGRGLTRILWSVAESWPRDGMEEPAGFRNFKVGARLDALDYMGKAYSGTVTAVEKVESGEDGDDDDGDEEEEDADGQVAEGGEGGKAGGGPEKDTATSTYGDTLDA